jgi:hypothetical protein
MIDRVLGPLLGRRSTELLEVPAGVVLRRGRWLPTLGGLFTGSHRPAAAVTIGRNIVVHPRARLSPPLLRHELEHVRQWRARPLLFPLLYAWNHVRYGYRDNPYEVAARLAETDVPGREAKS